MGACSVLLAGKGLGGGMQEFKAMVLLLGLRQRNRQKFALLESSVSYLCQDQVFGVLVFMEFAFPFLHSLGE